ncbi:MAG: hypothetical protein HY913_22000 [Desulfomonile tiedjei]|nr:hypothetical protein [Desulfomonile tiedjei]
MTVTGEHEQPSDKRGRRVNSSSSTINDVGRFSKLIGLALAAVAFIWPLVYFYRLLIPGRSFSLTIGNDFYWFYKYKAYLLDLLVDGRFPLWSPSEGGGFPFFSSPFAQALYPFNLPLFLFSNAAGGYSVFDHQAFTVLAMSFYALGLYLWLSRLVSNKRSVIFAVLVVGVSFKLAELVRFPHAAHAAAWMPWLLYGTTLAAEDGKRLAASLVLFVSSLLMLTAGYPYYAYYCLFLVVPYAAFLFFPTTGRLIRLERPGPIVDRRGYLGTIAVPVVAATALCSPYLYKMVDLMRQTTGRGGMNYDYSTSYPFHFADTIGSLIFPPLASTEGWYYFSILGLLLIVLFVATSFLIKQTSSLTKWFVFLMLGWAAVISYISYGRDSYLFDLLWSYLPGFSQLRAWGRLNITLLPIIALLLARSYGNLEELLGRSKGADKKRSTLSWALIVVAVSAATIMAAQAWLYAHKSFNFYWGYAFSNFQGHEAVFIIATAVSSLLLAGLLILAMRRPLGWTWTRLAVLVVCLAAATADMRYVGAQQWTYPAPQEYGARKRLGISQAIGQSMWAARHNLLDTISLDRHFNAGYMWDWHYDRYTSFHARVFWPYDFSKIVGQEGELLGMRRLLGMVDGTRVFVSTRLDHNTVGEFFEDSDWTVRLVSPQVTVQAYDGERLELQVSTSGSVFLSFIDNWDPDWVALVNGRPVEIEKLFGTFKSVRLTAGTSQVEFLYRPFSLKKR